MQSHIGMSYPSLELYEEAFRKYNELGLEIHVTELDIDQKTGTPEAMLELAKRYQDVFKLYKNLVNDGVNITAVVVWGISDNTSWIGGYPNLFDSEYQAKDAFYAVVDTDTPVKLIQTANAIRITEKDSVAQAFEVQKKNWVGDDGYFKIVVMEDDDVADSFYVCLEVTTLNDGDKFRVITDPDDPEIASEWSSGSAGSSTYELWLPGKISDFKFDIQINDSVWNGYDFDNQTGTMGTVNVVDMPRMAEAVYGTAVIDGEIDELWGECPEIETDKFTMGSAPATGISRMMWDEKYVYILTEVMDPKLSKASANAYEQDTVEVFFDENNGKTSGYEADDIQCRVNFDNEKTVTDGRSTDDFISATTITDTGYIVEMAIPYVNAPFESGQVVGFDVQINDDDGSGERTGIANWSDITGMGYTNTKGFGVLRLTGEGQGLATVYGDADLDGEVKMADVIKIMCYSSNKELFPLSAQALDNCDVYQRGDGVTLSDALSVQKKVAQVIDTLPES
ncbi:MAG: endo-1,4-beta-xylanase [Ruminococcus sp.]|nr:endo-1,4-beta-xylanase [Ruminococcus sp.]